MSLVLALLGALRAALRTRTDLTLENLALQQQLALLRRRSKRPKFGLLDRAFWMWLSQWWTRWSGLCRVARNHHRRHGGRFSKTTSPTYGGEFRRRVKGMCIAEVLSSPRSPWQNPFAERVIGTLRRELLDHVIVLSEGHLRRRLRSYLRYYHGSRTHLALEKDAPQPRAVEAPELGHVVALPHVGGLHHRYVRRAA